MRTAFLQECPWKCESRRAIPATTAYCWSTTNYARASLSVRTVFLRGYPRKCESRRAVPATTAYFDTLLLRRPDHTSLPSRLQLKNASICHLPASVICQHLSFASICHLIEEAMVNVRSLYLTRPDRKM